jgi:hypothetical protein
MLAVVEHQQELLATEMMGQVGKERSVWAGHDPERTGYRHRHQLRIAERGQINPDDAISKLIRDVCGDRHRQSRLSHTAGAGQGQERDGFLQQEGAGGGSLIFPAHELGAGERD